MQYTASMTKKPKTFRLSEQAQENLRQLVDITGSSETAILEISLASFRRFMESGAGEVLTQETTSTAGKAEQPKPNEQGAMYAEHDRDHLQDAKWVMGISGQVQKSMGSQLRQQTKRKRKRKH